MSIPTIEPQDIYRTQMMEAKLRLLAAERVSNSVSPVNRLVAFDSEFCFLQIRRVIELITFSSMSREEDRYRKLREQQHIANKRDHGNPARDWQAPEILKRLVTLSPHALPIPIAKAERSSENIVHFERHSISVNHGRLIELYEKCGGYMHGKNPLVMDFAALVESERKKYEVAPTEIRRALDFLRKLLWHHAVVQLDWSDPNDPKVVDNPSSAWLVEFGLSEGQDIVIAVAVAQDA